jgi:perosamine synthetase
MTGVLGYGRHVIGEDDVASVAEVLRGDFLTQGPLVDRFERSIADYVGARFAVACANGTAALHLACLAAGATSSSVALTQTITFIASANCIRYCNGAIRFVDISASSLGFDIPALQRSITETPEIGIIIPVHMGGLACGMADVAQIADGRIVIEDACHALGGTYEDGSRVGNCRYSAMTCFSFHPVKSLTTCEGGAITTNDPELYRRLRLLRSHGIERDPTRFRHISEGMEAGKANPWYYEQQVLGFNYRLSDVHAALGVSQFRKLDSFIDRRRAIALRYDAEFADFLHLRSLQSAPDQRRRSSHHLYLVNIDFAELGLSRREVMERLLSRGIGSQVHYIPVHRQPFHDGGSSTMPEDFPNAENYYAGCLSLPLHPALSDNDVAAVVKAIKAVAGG